MQRNNMAKPLAFITGASSGIGASFAKAFAKKGHDLILTGRRIKHLEAVAEECRKLADIDVVTKIIELSDIKQIDELSNFAGSAGIDILINNAGYGNTKSFINDDVENQIRMLNVHVISMIKLIHSTLPYMIKNRKGTIINVSSLASYLYTPSAAMYCGTKSFISTFSEVLHMEHQKDGVHIQSLCPGFTHTDFHEKLGIPPKKKRVLLSWIDPDIVVTQSLRCLEKGKVICVPGFLNKLIYLLVNSIPCWLYYKILNKICL